MWARLHDLHKGETGLVIGNGPSLNDVPLDFLKAYPSFGTNRIYLLDDFTPTYYAAVNWLVIRQSLPEINAIDTDKFILTEYAHDVPGSIPLLSVPAPHFSFDPREGLWEGFTVTYICLQLAWWMGFEKILLVGVDHRYHCENIPNLEITSNEVDSNHFHPQYFGPGTNWNLPDLEQSTWAYRLAETAYTATGRQILNLTHKSALHVFKKGSIADYADLPVYG